MHFASPLQADSSDDTNAGQARISDPEVNLHGSRDKQALGREQQASRVSVETRVSKRSPPVDISFRSVPSKPFFGGVQARRNPCFVFDSWKVSCFCCISCSCLKSVGICIRGALDFFFLAGLQMQKLTDITCCFQTVALRLTGVRVGNSAACVW